MGQPNFKAKVRATRPTATRDDVLKAMDGHIAGHATLVAPFNR
jgi:hypothetical protein